MDVLKGLCAIGVIICHFPWYGDEIVNHLFPLMYKLSAGSFDLSPIGLLKEGRAFLQEGTGPGSFYYPIMMQFIFVYPIIYFAIKEKSLKVSWSAVLPT